MGITGTIGTGTFVSLARAVEFDVEATNIIIEIERQYMIPSAVLVGYTTVLGLRDDGKSEQHCRKSTSCRALQNEAQ